jgi:CheY-like chemotaxis protein
MLPILIVDNEASIRRLLRLILTRAGYRVAEVPDGRAALDWMRGCGEPTIVLLATTMPTAAIEAVAHAVMAEASSQPHACVLLTAMPESLPSALRPLLAAYAIPVVGAPFSATDLLDAIACAVARTLRPIDIERGTQQEI